jgi:hypothetical protein
MSWQVDGLEGTRATMRRVIQFSTGNVGQHSLRAIIGRPDLELWDCTPPALTRSAGRGRTVRLDGADRCHRDG